MKTIFEKEKKLRDVLDSLNNLELKNPHMSKEIEKKDLENKYHNLKEEYEKLKHKLEEFNEVKMKEKKRESEFTDKIDELNQETDILLEEIDKWQM